MNRVSNTLAQIESHLQSLVEDSSTKIFPQSVSYRQMAILLEETLREGLTIGIMGEQFVPSRYRLMVHPEHAMLLDQDFAWLDRLEQSLEEIGNEAGFTFISPPTVRIVASPDLQLGEMRFFSEDPVEPVSVTAGNKVDQENNIQELPGNGFLIVNGTEIFDINQPVINIGRRTDNQLVLNDTRVSRLHAQLRIIDQTFVIFDLKSSGGTWVNGERVSQYKLSPGDVISLAGVPLVFGLESDPSSETQDIKPVRREENAKK